MCDSRLGARFSTCFHQVIIPADYIWLWKLKFFCEWYVAIASCVNCQDLQINYELQSIAKIRPGICSLTDEHRKRIEGDIDLLVDNTIATSCTRTTVTRNGYGSCDCGGPGWRKAAYLNMSDPTQTCPPAWELVTTPRRSCARPSNTGIRSCYYSARMRWGKVMSVCP